MPPIISLDNTIRTRRLRLQARAQANPTPPPAAAAATPPHEPAPFVLARPPVVQRARLYTGAATEKAHGKMHHAGSGETPKPRKKKE